MRHARTMLAAVLWAAGGVALADAGGGMTLIPAGPAILGGGLGAGLEGPKPYEVAAFRIDRFEVTNAQYAAFADATGRPPPMFFDDPAFNAPDQPATGVTWDDARAFCAWAGKRLPTEIEWEKAARGTDGRAHPWGDRLDASRAHLSGDRPAAASAFPGDVSPFGVRGMGGNVSEWVADTREARAGICGEGHHGMGHGMAATPAAMTPSEPCAFIKGASFAGLPHMAPASNRMWDYADAAAEFVGFRCAADAD